MLKFRKQHKDAVIQIANYKGPITKDNISDPYVQRALSKHPKLWEEGNALEQVEDEKSEDQAAPKKTSEEKAAERKAAADLDTEGRAETARLVREAAVDGPQLTSGEANVGTTDASKAGTEVKGKAQPESNKGATTNAKK